MQGKVYKSTGSWYVVKTADGDTWNARLKGIFKLDGITSTNPLAVGDDVEFEPENEGEKAALVTTIHNRHNYINRQSPSHRMQHHIVAANIDQSLLIVTLKDPRTSQGFVDRWLESRAKPYIHKEKNRIFHAQSKDRYRIVAREHQNGVVCRLSGLLFDSEHSRYVLEPNVSRQQLADSSSLGADSTQLLKVTLGLHTAEAGRS